MATQPSITELALGVKRGTRSLREFAPDTQREIRTILNTRERDIIALARSQHTPTETHRPGAGANVRNIRV